MALMKLDLPTPELPITATFSGTFFHSSRFSSNRRLHASAPPSFHAAFNSSICAAHWNTRNKTTRWCMIQILHFGVNFKIIIRWSSLQCYMYRWTIIIIIFIPSYYFYTFNKVKSKTKSWNGHSSFLEKLLCSRMELKRWIVINMYWKKLGSRLSSETDAILRPSSEKKAIYRWLIQRAKCLCCDRLEQATCLYQRVVFSCLPTSRLFSCCTTWASRHAHIRVR